MKKTSKILLTSIIILVIAASILASYLYFKLNKVNKVEIDKANSELNISDTAANKDDEIINIALLGLDRRNKDEASRSDALMILTLDKKHKDIKISSIMRDSYVDVDGYGKTKITHAYAYGGPTLAIKTLNKNFDLNIRDYVAVDFFGLEKIIDSVGGININITSDELKYINKYITETSKLENASVPTVTEAGLQKLNGRQAVAYTRIRYTEGGDFERTQRQRTVLIAVLNKIKETNPTNIASVVSQLLPYAETSMSNTEMLKSLASISTLGIKDIDQQRFPIDGYYEGNTINGVWYLTFNLDATKNQMHNYLLENIKPTSSK